MNNNFRRTHLRCVGRRFGGGAKKTQPAAQEAFALLDVPTAVQLSKIIEAVGLPQNLATLLALTSEGIQRGQMVLHARNIALKAGTTGE